ncbi:hypothetical protein ADICYQ_0854 [Cyclobacterium qasimii M12-11B]|nr:Fic family protein [Cyclobacterium qasimii]EPR70858.1 hypothetical protein ADICYQ_0854 [Cyclobacterium qasimii M12-11B]
MAFYIQNRDNWTDFTWDGKKVLLKLSEIGHLQGKLLDWIENEIEVDPVLKAAMAHLWFVTIHPFEDGNGRKTRAITEMILARSDRQYATKKF